MMEVMSLWGPLIYAGCFAATLSSAIASIVGAPRIFQAVAKDKLFPGKGGPMSIWRIEYFGQFGDTYPSQYGEFLCESSQCGESPH